MRKPRGYLGDAKGPCKCNPVQIERSTSRVSGPLLDRIDLHIVGSAVPIQECSCALRSAPPLYEAHFRQVASDTSADVGNAKWPIALGVFCT